MGRIIRPLPWPGHVVRTVIVKTSRGEYVRPVSKLCLLNFVKSEIILSVSVSYMFYCIKQVWLCR